MSCDAAVSRCFAGRGLGAKINEAALFLAALVYGSAIGTTTVFVAAGAWSVVLVRRDPPGLPPWFVGVFGLFLIALSSAPAAVGGVLWAERGRIRRCAPGGPTERPASAARSRSASPRQNG